MGLKCLRAKVDLPEPVAPIRTTRDRSVTGRALRPRVLGVSVMRACVLLRVVRPSVRVAVSLVSVGDHREDGHLGRRPHLGVVGPTGTNSTP